MDSKIILISGYARSGKDTLADLCIKIYEEGAKKYSFARPIKEAATKYFGWDGEKDEKGRQLLIDIGNIGRRYDENIWVDNVIKAIKEEKPEIAVISDWRFKNEYKRFIEMCGQENVVTVRIKRKGIKILDDKSEHDLDDFEKFNFVIENNGTIEDLEAKATILLAYTRYKDLFEMVGDTK